MCSPWLASCGGLGIPDTMLMSDGSCSWQVGRCAPGMMDVHMCDPEGWVATRRERQCSLVLASSHRSRARAALDGSRLNRTSAGPGSGPTHLTPSQCDWGGLPPAPLPTSCKDTVHAAAAVRARGDPAYCGHGWSFRHGWFAHFYTKSRQEFEEKNSRGDAFFASRKKVRRVCAACYISRAPQYLTLGRIPCSARVDYRAALFRLRCIVLATVLISLHLGHIP